MIRSKAVFLIARMSNRHDHSGAGRQLAVSSRSKSIAGFLACMLPLILTGSFDEQGYAGTPSTMLVSSAPVLANQVMTVFDDPENSTESPDGVVVVSSGMWSEAPQEDNLRSGEATKNPGGRSRAGATRGVLVSAQDRPGRGGSGRSALRKGGLIQSVVIDRTVPDRVTVARNGSVVINLKAEVDGVEIADPKVADVYLTSPTRIVVTGKSFGTTRLLLRVGEEQRAFNVDVELDLSLLESFIKSVSPTADVRARSVNGVIFLMGTVPDIKVAQQITEMAGMIQGGEVRSSLTVAGAQQVMLRVVVAEVNKSAVRQLGVNWAVGGSNFSRDFFFSNNLGQLNPTVFGNSGVADLATGQQLFSMLPTANGPGTNVTFGFPRAEFQMFLNALRENNLSRTLAEPNLVAISGQTASFLAGGEVPIPVTQGGAVSGAITIDYKEFGVRLSFTPTVLAGQIVRLHVMTEVSEAIPTNQLAGGLPLFTFTTRRVESTIECGNGQTFAIAGLLNDQIRGLSSKIPGLGDLPVLGTLFSSTDYERSITEMVVLVTPQMVEPLDPHQVPPPPGSLMTEPNDFELFAMQKLEGTPNPRPTSDGVARDRYGVKTQPDGSTGGSASELVLRGPWGLAGFEGK